MGKEERVTRLTNRELDIMAVLWELGSGTVQEVWKGLDADLAYSTVLTMLRTLETKGHVRHEQEGKAFRYHPVLQPEDNARLVSLGLSKEQCERIKCCSVD